MKLKQKIIVDFLMTLLFIMMMSYQITGNMIHEWLGILLFALFFFHNLLNVNWHKSLLKGKYKVIRIFYTLINLLLLISICITMVSGIMISQTVFDFLNLHGSLFWHKMHLSATSWGYILMSIHLGFHFGLIISWLNKIFKGKILNKVIQFLVLAISAYGFYAFINQRLWERLFLLTQFAFFSHTETPLLYFMDYLGIITLVVSTTYFIINLFNNKNKQRL